MKTPVITIIGAGNMGESLIGGLIKNKHPSDKLWTSDPSNEKLQALKSQFNLHVTQENKEAAFAADVIIFAVKPQIIAPIILDLAAMIRDRKPLLVSIAAGIRTTSIEHLIASNVSIVRAMPNTPALIGCGATALYANAFVSVSQRNLAESLLRALGLVVWVNDEHLLDIVTALSGSGPAYFFLVMEALQNAAEELGLPKETAHHLTLETALGAARMAIESGKSLTELRQQVTSPQGTTEKAISVLEENNLRGIFKEALKAAALRSEELALLMERDHHLKG